MKGIDSLIDIISSQDTNTLYLILKIELWNLELTKSSYGLKTILNL
jgi:hypothetical protein